MELQWIPSATSSCYHAAEGLRRGLQLASPSLTARFAEAAENLAAEIRSVGLDEDRVWTYLCAYAHQLEANRQLITQALQKTAGAHGFTGRVAEGLVGRVADLEAAMKADLPDADTELQHRRGPIEQHWKARGPGLLRAFASVTDEGLLAGRAEIVLVYPAFGGGGTAHLNNNSIRVEAVLANVQPELPETVRVGWLLAQLNHDIPIYGERVHRSRLPLLAQLATLPPILQSAEVVELASLSKEMLITALSTWRIDVASNVETADIMLNWWDTYTSSRPSWNIALAALDQMLE